MLSADQKAEIRDIFTHFDVDENGVIDPKEFALLCQALDGEFPPAAIRIGLEVVDADGNGQIDFDEFLKWWSERMC